MNPTWKPPIFRGYDGELLVVGTVGKYAIPIDLSSDWRLANPQNPHEACYCTYQGARVDEKLAGRRQQGRPGKCITLPFQHFPKSCRDS